MASYARSNLKWKIKTMLVTFLMKTKSLISNWSKQWSIIFGELSPHQYIIAFLHVKILISWLDLFSLICCSATGASGFRWLIRQYCIQATLSSYVKLFITGWRDCFGTPTLLPRSSFYRRFGVLLSYGHHKKLRVCGYLEDSRSSVIDSKTDCSYSFEKLYECG